MVEGLIEIQDDDGAGLLVIKIPEFWERILAFKSKVIIPLVAIDDIVTDPTIIKRTISGSFRILGTSFGFNVGTFYKRDRGTAFFFFRKMDKSIMLTTKRSYKYKIIVIEVQDKEKTSYTIRNAIGNT